MAAAAAMAMELLKISRSLGYAHRRLRRLVAPLGATIKVRCAEENLRAALELVAELAHGGGVVALPEFAMKNGMALLADLAKPPALLKAVPEFYIGDDGGSDVCEQEHDEADAAAGGACSGLVVRPGACGVMAASMQTEVVAICDHGVQPDMAAAMQTEGSAVCDPGVQATTPSTAASVQTEATEVVAVGDQEVQATTPSTAASVQTEAVAVCNLGAQLLDARRGLCEVGRLAATAHGGHLLAHEVWVPHMVPAAAAKAADASGLEVGMEKADLLTKAMAELLTASWVRQEAAVCSGDHDGLPLLAVRRATMAQVLEVWRGRLGKDLTYDGGLANYRWGRRMVIRRLGASCYCWAAWHWATWHTRWQSNRLSSAVMFFPVEKVRNKGKRKGKH